ncbi:hypothetical protein TCAL_06936 [Tigriopus californicus]|uniref:Uncharacterized protein n=1 Tax=Tigriopus californicus TaxID=6832 RepID=A0A553NT43_TIGCA|nr:hypothetical protein TCAL_06936 [Tigriopus californicus]
MDVSNQPFTLPCIKDPQDSSSDWKETRLMVHRTLRKLSPVAAVKLIDTEHQREMNRSPSWKLIRNDEEVHICQLGSSPANSDGKYPRLGYSSGEIEICDL